jgi:hypothetical protein
MSAVLRAVRPQTAADDDGPTIEATRDRLENWGRWSRDPAGRWRIGSAERLYRPETLRGDAEADRRTPMVPIDVNDAKHVWSALMPTAGFPRDSALVLHGRHVHRQSGDALRAWLHRHGLSVRGRDLDALVSDAELLAHRRLHPVAEAVPL